MSVPGKEHDLSTDAARPWALEGIDDAVRAALMQDLTPSALWSLLLGVFEQRAERRAPAELVQQWERDGFTRPAPLDQRTFVALDQELLTAAAGFEAVELSPLAPLGVCSAVALASQNKIVSALRGTEASVPRSADTILFWLASATAEHTPSGASGDSSTASNPAAAVRSSWSRATNVRWSSGAGRVKPSRSHCCTSSAGARRSARCSNTPSSSDHSAEGVRSCMSAARTASSMPSSAHGRAASVERSCSFPGTLMSSLRGM